MTINTNLKNRNWEETFQRWKRPLGTTEDNRCENAVSTIKRALDDSDQLNTSLERHGYTLSVKPKGSFRDNTNIPGESDVDLSVVCDGICFTDFSFAKNHSDGTLGYRDVDYKFEEFRREVYLALAEHFGFDRVEPGNKALKVRENTYQVNADVTSCFEYRRFEPDGTYIKPVGLGFKDKAGNLIHNWPEQTNRNGIEKNKETGRRFKDVVRILKTLRAEMEESDVDAAKHVSSFLLQCLAWNVPNYYYQSDTLEEDVNHSLLYLSDKLTKQDEWKKWGEVNELKYLFPKNGAWTREQALNFVNAAWNYINGGL